MTRFALAARVVALAVACSVEAAGPQDGGPRSDQDTASRLASAARAVKQARVGIRPDGWARAHCVSVIPESGKAARGRTGRGVMSCRSADGWSAPLFVQLTKGSWPGHGDLVLLMESAVVGLAGVVSYVSSDGQLAAVDLSGSELAPDEAMNVAVYGRGAAPGTILASRQLSAPTDASPFLRALGARSMDADRATPLVTASQVALPSSNAETRAADRAMSDAELRAQLMSAEQTIDRMLGESVPSAVGTSGVKQDDNDPRIPRGSPRAGTVVVERARLLQLRQQLETILARLNGRS